MAQKRRTWSNRTPLLIGVGTFVGLALVVWVWGINTSIRGAVIGTGKMLVASNRTAVQHPDGGVVAQILVENGDPVQEGQVLVRLEDGELRSALALVQGQLLELLANEARLEAQLSDQRDLVIGPDLQRLSQEDPRAAALLGRQQRQLQAHYDTLRVQSDLIAQQIVQVHQQIDGITAELASQRERLLVVQEELSGSHELAERGLLKIAALHAQRKDKLSTEGTIGKLVAKAAELRGRVAELQLQQHMLAPKAYAKSAEDLNKLRPEKIKQAERQRALQDQLAQLDIRAPISGRVHDSQVLGLRSVIVAAKPVLYVVPDNTPVSANVRIHADDIDQIYMGQEALIRFSAFSKRRTPLVYGQIDAISADALIDAKTRKPYYDVWLTLDPASLEQIADQDLVAGMPVSAFITTEERTPLSYVARPLWEYFERAFRDA